MEQHPVRRSVRLDVVDERIEFLSDRNIFIMGGLIDPSAFFGLLTRILPRLYLEKKPIWIILHSPGGDVFSGLAVYDLLKAIAEQGVGVNIIGSGLIASMAVCVMQAGTKRYAFPHAQFVVHQASLTGDGEPLEVNQMMENAKELERINGIVLKIISERSGIDLKELNDLSFKKDHSISADKAKEFGSHGLIDEVVTTFPFTIVPING